MKIEKRGELTPEEAAAATQAQAEQKDGGKQKPVLLYLVILFAIVIMLLLISFVITQRSNTAMLKELQSQVDTAQELREVEAKYNAACEENESLKAQVQEMEDQAAQDAKVQQALTLVWQMERLYASGDNDACRAVLKQLQQDDLYLLLPTEGADSDPAYESPRAAYDRISAALNGENEAE